MPVSYRGECHAVVRSYVDTADDLTKATANVLTGTDAPAAGFSLDNLFTSGQPGVRWPDAPSWRIVISPGTNFVDFVYLDAIAFINHNLADAVQDIEVTAINTAVGTTASVHSMSVPSAAGYVSDYWSTLWGTGANLATRGRARQPYICRHNSPAIGNQGPRQFGFTEVTITLTRRTGYSGPLEIGQLWLSSVGGGSGPSAIDYPWAFQFPRPPDSSSSIPLFDEKARGINVGTRSAFLGAQVLSRHGEGALRWTGLPAEWIHTTLLGDEFIGTNVLLEQSWNQIALMEERPFLFFWDWLNYPWESGYLLLQDWSVSWRAGGRLADLELQYRRIA
jgi:hypothetical protein